MNPLIPLVALTVGTAHAQDDWLLLEHNKVDVTIGDYTVRLSQESCLDLETSRLLARYHRDAALDAVTYTQCVLSGCTVTYTQQDLMTDVITFHSVGQFAQTPIEVEPNTTRYGILPFVASSSDYREDISKTTLAELIFSTVYHPSHLTVSLRTLRKHNEEFAAYLEARVREQQISPDGQEHTFGPLNGYDFPETYTAFQYRQRITHPECAITSPRYALNQIILWIKGTAFGAVGQDGSTIYTASLEGYSFQYTERSPLQDSTFVLKTSEGGIYQDGIHTSNINFPFDGMVDSVREAGVTNIRQKQDPVNLYNDQVLFYGYLISISDTLPEQYRATAEGYERAEETRLRLPKNRRDMNSESTREDLTFPTYSLGLEE